MYRAITQSPVKAINNKNPSAVSLYAEQLIGKLAGHGIRKYECPNLKRQERHHGYTTAPVFVPSGRESSSRKTIVIEV
jgi:hypothetical protein